jgi:hypothetical protein
MWYIVYMGVLNLRKIPDDLIRRMKARAAENGVTLRDECLEVIRRHCGVIGSGSAGEVVEGDHVGRGGPGSSSPGPVKRAGNDAAVPVLPKPKSSAKRLRAVYAVRPELAGRRKPIDQPSVVERAVSNMEAHEGHRVLPYGAKQFCATCGVAFQ